MKPTMTEAQWRDRQRIEGWRRRTEAWLLFMLGLAVGVGFTTLAKIAFMAW